MLQGSFHTIKDQGRKNEKIGEERKMAYEVVDLECPGCGYHVTSNTKQCPQCYREIMITNLDSASSMADADARKYTNKYRKVLSHHPDQPELNLTMAFCFLKV